MYKGIDNKQQALLSSRPATANAGVRARNARHQEARPPMAIITPFDNYLDLVEAARELNIHPQSLRRLIKQKKIPATLFAGKYLIERDKLEMFKSNYDPRPGRKPIRRLL
jgi:excisionase family DNA binding protein